MNELPTQRYQDLSNTSLIFTVAQLQTIISW